MQRPGVVIHPGLVHHEVVVHLEGDGQGPALHQRGHHGLLGAASVVAAHVAVAGAVVAGALGRVTLQSLLQTINRRSCTIMEKAPTKAVYSTI